jgi:hypothetical protein
MSSVRHPATWAAIGTLFMGAAALIDEPYKHFIVFFGLGCATLGIILGDPQPAQPDPTDECDR